MLKNVIKKRIIISSMTLIILFVIYIIPVNKKYESNVSINSKVNKIYLLNDNNLLVRVSIISNDNDIEDKIKEIIDSLTINNKNSNYLNNKLKPILPENTKVIDLSLDDKLLKINFSKDFLNINKENEEKMIESLVYSLTELDEVDKIMIFIESQSLLELPNSGKKLPLTLDKNYGINKIYDITTIGNISKVTLYYFTSINNEYDIVPVTLFTNDSQEKIDVIIKNLKSSSIYQTDLVSFLSNNTKLLDYEIEENKVKLNFNQYLLDDFYDDYLIEEVKYAISKSIEDSLNIDNVIFLINGKEI